MKKNFHTISQIFLATAALILLNGFLNFDFHDQLSNPQNSLSAEKLFQIQPPSVSGANINYLKEIEPQRINFSMFFQLAGILRRQAQADKTRFPGCGSLSCPSPTCTTNLATPEPCSLSVL